MLHFLRYEHRENNKKTNGNTQRSLTHAIWHPLYSSCIGIVDDCGVFEYKDISSQQSALYYLCTKAETTENVNDMQMLQQMSHPWIDFSFLIQSPFTICFSLQNSCIIYETQFMNSNEQNTESKSFPNCIQSNMINITFDVKPIIKCHSTIECFSIDFQCLLFLIYNAIYLTFK